MSSHSHHSDTNLYSNRTLTRDKGKGKRSQDVNQVVSSEEAKLISILEGSTFTGTRYPHRPTMQALGISRELGKLYDAADIIGLIQEPREGYKTETCHFLTTVNLNLYEVGSGYAGSEELGNVSFKVRGVDYTVPLSVVDRVYGFRRGSGQFQDYDRDELNELWLELTGGDNYSSSRSKSSEIRHPAVRYLHKTLANTMFAKKSTGTVNEGELRILDKALRGFLIYSSQANREDGIEMRGDLHDTGNAIVLVRHLMSYRSTAIRNKKMVNKEELTMGGIVTPLLEAAGVDLTSDPTPPLLMDMAHMRDTQTVGMQVQGRFIFNFNFSHPRDAKAKILLPYMGLPKIYAEHGDRSIAFIPPARDLYRPEGELADDEPFTEYMDSVQPPESFYFDDKECKNLKEANQKISVLQRWCKWQDRGFKAFTKSVNATIKGFTKRLVAAENKQRSPSLVPTYLRRTSSLRGSSRRFHHASPSRRSSVDHVQRKRRPDHPVEHLEHLSPEAENEEDTTRPAESSGLPESSQRYAQPTPLDQPWSSNPLESQPRNEPTDIDDPNTTMVPFYTEESMQARIDAYFSSRQ